MPATTAHAAPSLRDALCDALRDLTGTRAYVEQTGGNCEAIVVGPLDNGTYLLITDGDAGIPAASECRTCATYGADPECEHDNRGWLVGVCPHHPFADECDLCGDCCSQTYLAEDSALWTVAGLLPVVVRALSGERS